MMHKPLLPLLLLTIGGAVAALTTPTATMTQQGNGLQVTPLLPGAEWPCAQLSFSLYEGKRQAELPPGKPDISEKDGRLTVTFQGDGWRWETVFTAEARLFLGESMFTNTGKSDLWIEPGLIATFGDSTPSFFWDGTDETREIGVKEIHRLGFIGKKLKNLGSTAFPFAATAIGFKNTAFSLGHVNFAPVSYAACHYIPEKSTYSYTQRHVVSPGQTVTFRHTVTVSDTSFGLPESIIQQHYDSLPDCWTVSGGQSNPYIWGNNAHYQNWWGVPKPEESRRLYHTIEWTYCPYKRSGDIACRADLWDYTPHNPYREQTPKFGGKRFSFKTITREDFLKMRNEGFHKYGQRYGWMFYVTCSGTWCEYNLGHERYEDSLNLDSSSPILLNSWSTGHDREVRVFPMGTSFAKQFEQDLVDVTRELDLPGFALDCGSGGVRFRGKACEKPLPGRAWDDQGVFIDQGVAVNHEVDFMRAINPQKPLTVFINGYMKGDYCMLEKPYVEKSSLSSFLPLYRWFIGPRPGCMHGHGFAFEDMVPGWRTRTKEEFLDIMAKMSDYIILNQFKWGLTNSYVTFFGCPQQVYVQPEALELARSGWQAEVPITLSQGLYAPYLSRYGNGAYAFFYLGNSGPAESSGKVTIDGRILCGNRQEAYLYVEKRRDHAQNVNMLENQQCTLAVALPSRTPFLLETVCGFVTAPAEKLVARTASQKTLSRQKFTVVLERTAKFTSVLQARRIHGFRLAKATLDGQTVAMPATGEWLHTSQSPLSFHDGSRLELEYESLDYAASSSELAQFPYVDGQGKIAFSLRIPEGEKELRAQAALRFGEYFTFCREKKLIPAGDDVGVTDKEDGPQVILTIDRQADNRIRRQNGNILIKTTDVASADHLLTMLFYQMDKRFAYHYPFKWVMGLPGRVLYHFKMNDKTLPWTPYFEEVAK